MHNSLTRDQAAAAMEVTQIPVDPRNGYYGAMAFFAVLAYPGTDERAHARRDQVMTALSDWIVGVKKRQRGFRRLSHARLANESDPWLVRGQKLKDEVVLRTLNRLERIVVNRRLRAARIAEHLAGVWASKHFQATRLQIRIKGPQSLAAAISELTERRSTGDESTLWRIWRESLPVLHLARAFDQMLRDQTPKGLPHVVIPCLKRHEDWLAETLLRAEANVHTLPLYTNFDPCKRIALIAE